MFSLSVLAHDMLSNIPAITHAQHAKVLDVVVVGGKGGQKGQGRGWAAQASKQKCGGKVVWVGVGRYGVWGGGGGWEGLKGMELQTTKTQAGHGEPHTSHAHQAGSAHNTLSWNGTGTGECG